MVFFRVPLISKFSCKPLRSTANFPPLCLTPVISKVSHSTGSLPSPPHSSPPPQRATPRRHLPPTRPSLFADDMCPPQVARPAVVSNQQLAGYLTEDAQTSLRFVLCLSRVLCAWFSFPASTNFLPHPEEGVPKIVCSPSVIPVLLPFLITIVLRTSFRRPPKFERKLFSLGWPVVRGLCFPVSWFLPIPFPRNETVHEPGAHHIFENHTHSHPFFPGFFSRQSSASALGLSSEDLA